MNDFIFDNIVFSLQKSGGISVVWYELLKRILKDTSLKTRFIDYGKGFNPYRDALDIDEKKILNTKLFSALSRYNSVSLKLDRPFIFHSSYYRICKSPYAINVTTVHDFTYEYFRKGIAKYVHCWQKYNAFRHSNVVVCISENTKQDLLKFVPDVDENKIRVIYNGVSEDYCQVDNYAGYDLPYAPKKYVLFVGSRVSYKNFELAVRGVATTDYNFVIVGSQLTSKEEEYVSKFLPKNRYKTLGFLPNKDLNTLYNFAAALIYPSSYEGFGIPVLEAQRAGCPVIAFNGSSIPEIIGCTPLLMRELTERELESKLKLLSDKDLVKRIVNEGLSNSLRFSWDKMYSEYIELYNEIYKIHLR